MDIRDLKETVCDEDFFALSDFLGFRDIAWCVLRNDRFSRGTYFENRISRNTLQHR